MKSESVNYRPVWLTAIPWKTMEHCIVSNIWSHLNKHSIITSKQHGFRRGISCETQLIEATYGWTNIKQMKGPDRCNPSWLLQGFHVVPHHRLLMKPYMYFIAGKTHRWIKDLIENRTQEVVVYWSKSDRGMVQSGVPQGTVLGPLLFLTYINLKSPVLLTFSLMIVPFTDQYILKVILFLYKKTYSSCRSGQIHGKWHLILIKVSYFESLIAVKCH